MPTTTNTVVPITHSKFIIHMSTLTFKVLRSLHVMSNEAEHGNMTFFGAVRYGFSTMGRLIALKYCYSSFLLEPLNFKYLRTN